MHSVAGSKRGPKSKAVWGARLFQVALSLWLVTPALPVSAQTYDPTTSPTLTADKLDDSVRESFARGHYSHVIMRFGTAVERDAAFLRLLDAGAAVRVIDADEPVLNVYGSPAVLGTELARATRLSSDAAVRVAPSSAAVSSGKPPLVRAIGKAAQARQNIRGGGVTVAVIDSGYQPHPDIPSARILKFKDFVNGSLAPVDGCGHGTHVAGIIAGSGYTSGGAYEGVSPDSNLVILRVLANDCSGKTSDVIEALQWVKRHRHQYGIKVVNLSLGHPVFERSATDPMVHAVDTLAGLGVVVVTAAGNAGVDPKGSGKKVYGGVGVPCNALGSICVGAGDSQKTPGFGDDYIAPYSSNGPTRFDLFAKPDLVATGHRVTSLSTPGSFLFTNHPALQVPGGKEAKDSPAGYFTLSGTSMASPMVAGAAALVLDRNPRLAANAVKMVLQYTARVLPGVDALTQGTGYLNTIGAMELAANIETGAPRGANWLRHPVVTSNEDLYGQTVKWGRRIIWGDRFVKGSAASMHLARWDDEVLWGVDALFDNIVWGNCAGGCDDSNIVWGNYLDVFDNIVWGNARLDDDNIVWGNIDLDRDNIVWGENIVWGYDNIVWGYWAGQLIQGFWADNIVWGNVTKYDQDNIVWGNDAGENIVWGNDGDGGGDGDNIVWGNDESDNIVWGNFTSLQILTGGIQ